jgi:ABC-2 type transport system permease protein
MTTNALAQASDRRPRVDRLRDLRIYALEAKTEFLKVVRMPAYALPTLAFPVMFYVLFGLAFGSGQVGATRTATYMIATYGAFGVMGAALFGFGVAVAVERGQGWMLLKRAMPAPAGAWITAKVSLSLIFAAVIVLLLSVLGFAFGHVRLPLSTWSALATILVAGAVPFSAFGLALGYLAGPNSAPAVVNLIYLPMAFASGLWIPVEMLPGFMKTIALALPAYHYAQLALGVLGAGRGGPAWSHVAMLTGFTVLSLAVALFAYRHDEGRTYG